MTTSFTLRGLFQKAGHKLLTERSSALVVLMAIMILIFWILGEQGILLARYDIDYLASSLEALVPIALLALAEMFVIISGYSGIDLSVGAIVSLGGIFFGYFVQILGMPVVLAALLTIFLGALMGLVNGIMVGYARFPPLIATLSTSYIYASLAMVISGQAPISGSKVAATNELTSAIILYNVAVPKQVITFLIPAALISWIVLRWSNWGHRLVAVGTNEEAARYSALSVGRVRCTAYVVSGTLCGLAAVVNVAQFASARPDAGMVGSGMALPAITVAVLGGVVIRGGYGKVGSVFLAALLVTWLNAGLLVSFMGSVGPRMQLLALGVILIGAVLVNTFTTRTTSGV
ncbi:ABC transporter permease [Mobiluncus mulieris]|uniref:Autoinducer 2 import system permease protein LsrD n=1 Tax=Mobiluncus mulieris TaxID=2052 RepID=A0A7Y0U1A7_9ACTO|nr:ABC transporter permease [Mobiluncus mulieris]NMW65064.1 ABC transporter permease [Mobiluncus mulieris]